MHKLSIYPNSLQNSMTTQHPKPVLTSPLCPQHIFSLSKPSQQTHQATVYANFSPLTLHNQQQMSQSVTFKIHPGFNFDRLHYTPAFVLEVQKVRKHHHDDNYKRIYEARFEEINEQKQQIYVPRPSKQASTCAVCRNHFDDYLEHILSEEHLKNTKMNKYRLQIEALCEGFGKCEHRVEKGTVVKKQKKIKKSNKIGKVRSVSKMLGQSSSTNIQSQVQVKVKENIQETN